MTRKWTYFAGAVILAGYFLLASGAPPVAIAIGISLAALLRAPWWRTQSCVPRRQSCRREPLAGKIAGAASTSACATADGPVNSSG